MAIGGCPFTLRKREEKSKHPTQGERQVSRKQRRKVDSKAGRTSFLPKAIPCTNMVLIFLNTVPEDHIK